MPLGTALVVDDSNKGQRLVFRYPALREEALKGPGPQSAAARAAADFHLISPEVFARLFRPKTALCGKPLEVTIDRVCYLSYPVLTSSASKETNRDDILLFNVIIAISKVEPELGLRMDAVPGARRKRRLKPAPGDTRRISKEAVHEVLARLAQGLLHEERRCRYVSKEVSLLLQTREEVFGKEGWGGEQVQTMLDLMLERSALANDLRRVYHWVKDMSRQSTCRRAAQQDVLLNGWIRLSLPTCAAAVTDWPPSDPPVPKPFQTVLLTCDEDSLLSRIPADGSQQLATVIKALNPLKTLEEIALCAQMSVPQLELQLRHLLSLGHAKVTSAITMQSIYAVKSTACTRLHSLESLGFQQLFSPANGHHETLFQLLARFGSGRTLKSLMRGLKEEEQAELLSKVVWLLQHDLLEELHVYVHCTLSPDDPQASRLSPWWRKLLQAGQLDGSKHLVELLWFANEGGSGQGDRSDVLREVNDPASSPFLITTVRPSPSAHDYVLA